MSERLRFSATPGLDTWAAGLRSKSDMGPHAYYTLSGDLGQMGIMEARLSEAGFSVSRSQSGTYPGFLETELDEYKRALKFLYDRWVPGWWNQSIAMVEHGICTAEEFQAHFPDKE